MRNLRRQRPLRASLTKDAEYMQPLDMSACCFSVSTETRSRSIFGCVTGFATCTFCPSGPKAIRRSSAAEVGPIARQEYAVALHHAAELLLLLLLPCPTLSSDRSRMEKKNRVTANPYRERAKLEPKKLLRLAASQPIDGRW